MTIDAPDPDPQPATGQLADFITTGGWQAITIPGPASATTATRAYDDDTVEVLTTRGPDRAHGRREDPHGRLVWHHTGPLTDVIQALRDLPPPGHPDTPTTPIPDPGQRAHR